MRAIAEISSSSSSKWATFLCGAKYENNSQFSHTARICSRFVSVRFLLLSHFPILFLLVLVLSLLVLQMAQNGHHTKPNGPTLHTNVHEQNVTWWNKKKKKTIQTAGHPLHNGYLFNKKSHNVFFVCLFVMRLVFLNACMCMCCACLSFQGLWIVFMFAIVCFPRRAPWTMASVRCFYLDFWVYVIETWAYTIHICPCNL